MHVAITGVSGFIGSNIARHLHKSGHTVTGLVRKTSRRDHIEDVVKKVVIGDQADESCWPELLDGADCVIHNSVDWASIRNNDLSEHLRSNLNASIRLLHSSSPRQFIFISTIAVHHDMRLRWQGVIDEDHPLRPSGLYGAYKAAVEDHLWAEHFSNGRHVCAHRPCAVYGIDPNIERSHGYALIQKIKRGEKIDTPGGGKFVHVEDVAAAVAATIGNPDASGKVYNLVDCYARWADWGKIASELLGVTSEIDFSSPEQPKNVFTKEAARSIGVKLDRGHEGIRKHLMGLIDLM